MRKSVKLASLILALALLVCGIIGLTVSADEEEAKLEVESANVAYNDMMHLAFTLKNTTALPDGAEAGIIIWKNAQDEYTVSNASYKTFSANVDGKTTYYKSEGIAATEIGAEIYVAACYKLDGAITITEAPFKYSVVSYLSARLSENVTDVQAELYENVLTYGAASDKVLSENSFVLVKANGGYVGTFNRRAGASKEVSKSFLLRAPITNADGKYFEKWVNANGETISTDRVFNVTPNAFGISAYTAVYSADDATYGFGFGFEDLATGDVTFKTPDLTKLTDTTCYNDYSKSNMRRWSYKSSGLANISIQFYAIPAYTSSTKNADGTTTFAFDMDENGNYKLGLKDSATVSEKANGDKEMTYIRGINGAAGYETTYSNKVAGCKTAEIDFGFEKLTYTGVQDHIGIKISDGTNEASYRFNIAGTAADSTAFIYGEQSDSGARDENKVKLNGEVSILSIKPSERASVSITLNTSGDAPCFDFYYNGTYAGSLACSILAKHNASIDFSKAYIVSLNINAVSAAKDNFVFDNICFK